MVEYIAGAVSQLMLGMKKVWTQLTNLGLIKCPAWNTFSVPVLQITYLWATFFPLFKQMLQWEPCKEDTTMLQYCVN